MELAAASARIGVAPLVVPWRTLLGVTVAVILFIPIRRYTMPGNLPFELEPYRFVVALVAVGWIVSMLADGRILLRPSGLEGPLIAFAFAAAASVVVNVGRIRVLEVEADVVKDLTFLVSFFIVFYLLVSVVTAETLDYLVRLLVGGGAVVAAFALVESRTGYNAFDHLEGLPFLRLAELPEVPTRGARLRVYASSQHPIALGAAFVMIIPLAVYLVRRFGRRRYWLAAGLLALGALATVSRTSVMMLLVVLLVFLWLRPRETKRLWPVLVPLVVVVHVALPGTIGSLKGAFFPEGGLVAEQAANPEWRGAGRIADLGPSMEEFSRQPLLGQGIGTRVIDQERQNARILDNQWLFSLLEMGLAGAAALLWLFGRAVRRLARAAKGDDSARGWLAAALAASLASFAVGMFTYDAFSFIQVTFLSYILLGLSCVAWRSAT